MAAHFGAAHVVAEIVVFGNGGGINRVGELGQPQPESNLSAELNRGSPLQCPHKCRV